jgi:hypothetical protein
VSSSFGRFNRNICGDCSKRKATVLLAQSDESFVAPGTAVSTGTRRWKTAISSGLGAVDSGDSATTNLADPHAVRDRPTLQIWPQLPA